MIMVSLMQKGSVSVMQGHPGYVDGEAQPATAQISAIDTPLDLAQEETMPLMKCALTPIGHCSPKDE